MLQVSTKIHLYLYVVIDYELERKHVFLFVRQDRMWISHPSMYSDKIPLKYVRMHLYIFSHLIYIYCRVWGLFVLPLAIYVYTSQCLYLCTLSGVHSQSIEI